MGATTLDPYAALGIPAGASRAEAARAHRRLAKRYHPDVNRGPAATEQMRRINEAWRILSQPARRTRYGASRGSWRPTTATWTTWPESRGSAVPRARRPVRPDPAERTFGDNPAVVITIGVGLALFVFIGTWLGSVAR